MSNESTNGGTNRARPRPLGNLWPFLRFSFLAYISAEIALAISNIATLQFYDDYQNDAFGSDDALQAAASLTDLHQGAAGFLYLAAYFCCIIAYCRFQYRAMKNLHVIGAAGVVTSPGWSIGYFFVPILTLWKPFGAVCQIWRGTFDPENGEARVPAIIGWWWAMWLILTFLGNGSFRMQLQSGAMGAEITNLDLYLSALAVDIFSAGFGVAAALLVLNFMEKIHAAQDQRQSVAAFQ